MLRDGLFVGFLVLEEAAFFAPFVPLKLSRLFCLTVLLFFAVALSDILNSFHAETMLVT